MHQKENSIEKTLLNKIKSAKNEAVLRVIKSIKKEEILNVISYLQDEFSISRDELITILQDESVSFVPIEVFSSRVLSGLQALVHYLKEEKKFSFSKIGKLLNRDERTIWTTYSQAKKRCKKPIVYDEKPIEFIPIAIFRNRKLSVLENIIINLKEKEYTNKEISKLLQRGPTTISTVLTRAGKKQGVKK